MENIQKLISLKKINSKNIDSLIREEFENYKSELAYIESDVESAKNASISLNRYAELKTIKTMMQTTTYKAYEESEKKVSFEQFMSEN